MINCFRKTFLSIALSFTVLLGFNQNSRIKNLWVEFNQAQHDTTRILLLLEQIGYQYQSIDSDSAIMYYMMAADVADSALVKQDNIDIRLRLQSLKATALRYTGIVYQNIGVTSVAMDYFFKSLSVSKEIADKREMSRALNNLGIIHRRQGFIDDALEFYTQSLEISEELNDKRGMAYAYNNIGVIYRAKGDYFKAVEFFQKSINVRQELGDRKGVSHVSNNIGVTYRLQRDFNKALEYYNRSLSIELEINDRNGIAAVYSSLADLNIAIADSSGRVLANEERESYLRKAVDFAKKSLDISSDIGNFRRENSVARLLMLAYKALGEHSEALKYAEVFIATRDSMSNEDRTRAIAEMQALYKIEGKQQEIDKQKLIIEKQEIESQKQRAQRNFFIIVFSLSLVSAFVVFYGYYQKKKANRLITERAYEIETLNEELSATNDELHSQRDNLEEALTNLQNTQKQLIQSEKMATLGVLAAGVAHEINNPLNFIKGGILTIENFLKANLMDRYEEIEQMVEIVNTGVERSAAIVKSLGHYSRKDDKVKTETNIHSIIDNCLLMLNNQLKKRVEVVKMYAPQPLIFSCNEGRMHQAILNILSNASQAIEDKGTIIITTEQVADELIISIADSGCGISPENLDKITDPFFTTKEPGKGTGLGLSIALNIIEEHNGWLEFKSEVGVGTTVFLKFPRNAS